MQEWVWPRGFFLARSDKRKLLILATLGATSDAGWIRLVTLLRPVCRYVLKFLRNEDGGRREGREGGMKGGRNEG